MTHPCPMCGKETEDFVMTGKNLLRRKKKKYCCREHMFQAHSNRTQLKNPERHRDQSKKSMMKLYFKRKLAGLCVMCGVITNGTTCGECLEKRAARRILRSPR